MRILGQHDPHQFARARRGIEQTGAHDDFLEGGGHAFGAAVPDVVQQRAVANGAGVGLGPHARQVEPVVPVGPQCKQVVV